MVGKKCFVWFGETIEFFQKVFFKSLRIEKFQNIAEHLFTEQNINHQSIIMKHSLTVCSQRSVKL